MVLVAEVETSTQSTIHTAERIQQAKSPNVRVGGKRPARLAVYKFEVTGALSMWKDLQAGQRRRCMDSQRLSMGQNFKEREHNDYYASVYIRIAWISWTGLRHCKEQARTFVDAARQLEILREQGMIMTGPDIRQEA
ncbi:hypothetical protein Tco_0255851 [Tanacetum coccineum]